MDEIKKDEFEQDYKDFIENYWKKKQGLKDLEKNKETLNECDELLNKMKKIVESWHDQKDVNDKWINKKNTLIIGVDPPFNKKNTE